MEVFGTPTPSTQAQNRWRASWRNSESKIYVDSYTIAQKIIIEAEIDPLFYQFGADISENPFHDAAEKYYVIFFKKEHEVFFKLHYGIS